MSTADDISEEEKQNAIQHILPENITSQATLLSSVSNQSQVGPKTKVIYVQPSSFPENFPIFHQAGNNDAKQVHTVYAKTYGQYISQDSCRNDATTNIQASHNGHIYYVSPDGSMRQATTVPNVLKNNSKQVMPTIMPGTDIEYKTPGASFVNRQGKVKRPMNAFMLWARTYRSKIAQQMANSSNSEISIRLGQIWSSLPVGEKQKFYLEAERIKNRHRQCFPDWVYQPRKSKKPFLYSQVQHSRLWEKHSDQYAMMKSSVPTPHINGHIQRPAYRPIAPAAQVHQVNFPNQSVVVSGQQIVHQTNIPGHVGHIDENQRHFAQLFGTCNVVPQRPQIISLVPNGIMDKTFQNVMSGITDGQETLIRHEQVDKLDAIPFQKVLTTTKESDNSTKEPNESQGEGSVKATTKPTKQKITPSSESTHVHESFHKSEVIWPFPLPPVEKHNSAQTFFEGTVSANETHRQAYMDPYDPFYYKGNFTVSGKTSGDQLNVDVSSWQQYLNDYGQAKDSTEPKDQLGNYFSLGARKCPSDLDICPTPVASTLHRNEEDNSRSVDSVSTDSSQLNSHAHPVSSFESSNCCSQGSSQDNNSENVQNDRETSENNIENSADMSSSNALSFGNAMSQAVMVLNDDATNYQCHGVTREYIKEENIPIETTCIVEDIGNQSSKVEEIVIAPFQNQENLPFKKRTERLYQEYANDNSGNVRSSDGEKCESYRIMERTDGKSAKDVKDYHPESNKGRTNNPNKAEDNDKADDTYEITITRSYDGEEITETTIYISRDATNIKEGEDASVEPHAVLTQGDSNCTRDGDREDILHSAEPESSDSMASGDALPKLSVPTKRRREQECQKSSSKRRFDRI